MSNDIIEAANKAGQAAFEAAKEVAEINNATLDTLVEKQLAFASQVVDFGVKQIKLVTEAKDATSAVKAQVALVEDAAGQALNNARDLVDLANKTRVAYDKLVDKNVKSAVASLKTKKAA